MQYSRGVSYFIVVYFKPLIFNMFCDIWKNDRRV